MTDFQQNPYWNDDMTWLAKKFALRIVFHFAKLLETYPNWIALFDYFEEMGDRWIVEKEHSTILNSFSSWIPLSDALMVLWWRWSFSCKNLLRFCLFGYVCIYICIVFRLSRNNRLANRIFFLLSLHQCHEKKKMWSVFSKQYIFFEGCIKSISIESSHHFH